MDNVPSLISTQRKATGTLMTLRIPMVKECWLAHNRMQSCKYPSTPFPTSKYRVLPNDRVHLQNWSTPQLHHIHPSNGIDLLEQGNALVEKISSTFDIQHSFRYHQFIFPILPSPPKFSRDQLLKLYEKAPTAVQSSAENVKEAAAYCEQMMLR
ncbi:hypothetical protein K431DRAFT_35603 [Polychaeton citri CBS 116435]|uniref:Uncharacterized protein n=1 Tax=Polychaeton citri CBS 116435 TaxID=1314669 RepID=A0A9P4URJ2_9PEZI|nr:hypothetical protein K431DRAFT_35603 [Polychaeton citri CBS 116435]